MSTNSKIEPAARDFSKVATSEQLVAIGNAALGLASDEMAWYRRGIAHKRFAATVARWGSVAALGVSAAVPLAAALLPAGAVDPIYVTIALAAAGGLLGLDKVLGFSSGWIRYIKTHMLIEMRSRTFELEWRKGVTAITGADPTAAEAEKLLNDAIAFLGDIQLYVKEETNSWIQEFSNSFKEVEELVRKSQREWKSSQAAPDAGARTGPSASG
jgi:hypothetical protein